MSRGALWFIFNLQIKNGVSYTHILMTVVIVTYQDKVCFFTRITYTYILEQLSLGSIEANESIFAPLSKRTESFHSSCGIGCLTTSRQWLGLAISRLACPDLAADCCPNSNTCKSHRYATC
jgi:hypothetical protein